MNNTPDSFSVVAEEAYSERSFWSKLTGFFSEAGAHPTFRALNEAIVEIASVSFFSLTPLFRTFRTFEPIDVKFYCPKQG